MPMNYHCPYANAKSSAGGNINLNIVLMLTKTLLLPSLKSYRKMHWTKTIKKLFFKRNRFLSEAVAIIYYFGLSSHIHIGSLCRLNQMQISEMTNTVADVVESS